MKNHILITILSLAIFSCTKKDIDADTELHAIEYNESKTIVGEYNGTFTWSKSGSETIKQKAEESQQGTFSVTFISKNSLEVKSNISADLKYKVYEMTLAKVKQVDDHLEYYFTGKAKGYAENVNSFAEMSLEVLNGKNVLSLYSCNSFDGTNGEILHVFDATVNK